MDRLLSSFARNALELSTLALVISAITLSHILVGGAGCMVTQEMGHAGLCAQAGTGPCEGSG